MKPIHCKVLVLGAGPGGYVAAIRAGQLGLDTVIVDGQAPGGTCLNVGCIPSKAMIHAADEFEKAVHFAGKSSPIGVSVEKPSIDIKKTVEWKDGIVKRLNGGVAGLLRKNKVKLVEGWGRMSDGKTCVVTTDTGEQTIVAEHVIIATGSEAVELPFLKFNDKVISSTEALSLNEVPNDLVVVGGGYIGLELGIAMRKMGANVTVVEAMGRILPQYDAELTKPVAKKLEQLGITVLLNTKALGEDSKKTGLKVELADGAEDKIKADKILVTVGRRPKTEGWGLEEMDLTMDGKFVQIDDQSKTSMRNVWAIGDVTGEPMLAHRAMAQGEMVAEIIAGHNRSFDKVCIPAVCFTDPEVVVVGLSPDEAKSAGYETKIGVFPFMANGRSMTMEAEEGFVRVVARADNHLVLGIQAVGGGVSELSAGFALALEMGATLEDIAGTIHAHPTQSEGFQEAALKALGHALHI
ncbi:dihydrolipoyl dehydrogenase [Kordiimonas sp. SCSIO 12610]|uniref:dihydrolipoyl dehydrogenase n=1 Tax=Kordiimonas sp. SCSIO 12610 TaxID=2829597 RepID=UPI00210CB9BC|nr:dihydrolipoyl dehydrogenase [Kordiimonas sp. SCSIO 12610]UTW56559.1 dihydrolipoyl dehydrogenase [Kordiimonas sp. SCSIO 12610]